MELPLIIAGVALALAAVLYFVFLPHVEGPSLDEQEPDHKEWLVQCPRCGRWQTLKPHASTEKDARLNDLDHFVNRYECQHCGERWEEEVNS
ncbi:MAG: hypothetical protein QNJ45_24135 [Ardenticatenaceae bacterium]|nr:hypothetical protein [Ardenticatenaceae bacterium]